MKALPVPPKTIRIGQALKHLNVSPELFNEEFRPYLQEVKMGKQGVWFLLDELNEFADYYFRTYGTVKGDQEWKNQTNLESLSLVSSNEETSTISTNGTEESKLEKRLEQVIHSSPNKSSPQNSGKLTTPFISATRGTTLSERPSSLGLEKRPIKP